MAVSALETEFVGRGRPVFGLALRTGILTVLTLGLYRFWMKTRLRRFYWSSIRPGGHPLEYVGEPVEKLLGFLIAVVVLAFYIGVVNLGLMFVSFSLFQGNVPAYVLSAAGLVPLWFYARYRARRYVLARTRWRAIRFSLEPGAWGYALRAMGLWVATILSLGLLWPRMTFMLEKYRTDRTRYGSLPVSQDGHWTALYPATVHALIGVSGSIAATLVALADHPGMALLLVVFLPWAVYGLVHYQVHAFRIMTGLKRAGPLRFRVAPRARKVLRITALGYLATFILAGLFAGLVAAVGAALIAALGGGAAAGFGIDTFLEAEDGVVPDIPVAAVVLGVVTYFSIFVAWAAFRHALVILPTWRHYAETLTIAGPAHLAAIAQTGRDDHLEAEGFAEALDLGAAI